jgi:hypothetical protein
MTDTNIGTDPSPAVACPLSEQDLAQRSQEVARDLLSFAEHVDELPDGYAWRFPGDGEWHAKLLDFVATERRCCGFFRIEIVFEPGLGPVSLTLRGPDSTKAFITETFVAS